MYILKKDGKGAFIGKTYDACLIKLHNLTSVSWYHAMTYEGWTIEEDKRVPSQTAIAKALKAAYK